MKRLRKIRSVFYIIWFVLICVVSGATTISFLVRSGDEVVVPDIQGKSLSEATYLASLQKLQLRVGNSLYSSNTPLGNILRQSVPSGEHVRSGRTIQVDVSKGPREQIAARVVGSNLEVAKSILASSGLEISSVTYSCSDEILSGNVLAQIPQPGASFFTGNATLLVSSGPCSNRYVLGNILSLPWPVLQRALDVKGFLIRSVKREESENSIPGLVLSVEPSVGSIVTTLEKITLTISAEPKANQEVTGGESKWIYVPVRVSPGFFGHTGRLRFGKEGGLEREELEIFLSPGVETELALLAEPRLETTLEVDGKEIWRKIY